MSITAILLAAGHSRRFGNADKLLHPLTDGRSVAITAAHNLLDAVPDVVAVTRPHKTELQQALRALGVTVVSCSESEVEMADTLAAGIRFCNMRGFEEQAKAFEKEMGAQHHGYLIALADMPYIRSDTIRHIADALAAGASIVVPTYINAPHALENGLAQRGHPVAFHGRFSEELANLHGDTGAKSVLQQHAKLITFLPCDDPGILLDIDTLDDLRNLERQAGRDFKY